MNITELKKEELNLHLNVVIPAQVINTEVTKELTSLTKTVRIAGFRPGKVPLTVIQKKYGDSVRHGVVESQLKRAVSNIMQDRKLEVIGDPAVENLKMDAGKDLEFVVKFSLVPKITLPDFKKISLEQPVLAVGEKDIEEKLQQLLDTTKTYTKESKGKAAKGDQVIIDAIGKVDGKAFEGGKLEGHKLVLGSGVFIPGFEDQLIGLKAGSETTVKVTFPENYHAKELAGKPSEFEVKILSVFKSTVPELDEELLKSYGCKSVEELKEKLGKLIEDQYKEAINTTMKLHFFDQLEKLLTFEVPESLLDTEFKILQSNSEAAKASDPTLAKKSDKELEKYYKKLAVRRVRIGLMLAEYAKANNIQVNGNEIKQAVLNQARNFPGQENIIFDYYKKNPSALSALKGPILEEKAVTHIFTNQVNLSSKNYSRKKLEEMLDKENDRDFEQSAGINLTTSYSLYMKCYTRAGLCFAE